MAQIVDVNSVVFKFLNHDIPINAKIKARIKYYDVEIITNLHICSVDYDHIDDTCELYFVDDNDGTIHFQDYLLEIIKVVE